MFLVGSEEEEFIRLDDVASWTASNMKFGNGRNENLLMVTLYKIRIF